MIREFFADKMLLKLARSFVSLKPRISRQFISREMSSITEDILLKTEGGVGTILLNRPKVYMVNDSNPSNTVGPIQLWNRKTTVIILTFCM